jgi:PAS domain S-box-containing protein
MSEPPRDKLEAQLAKQRDEIVVSQRFLQQAQTRLQVLFDQAQDGILVADIASQRFVTGNQKICRMLRCTYDELCTLTVADIHPPEALAEVVRQFQCQVAREISLARDIPVLRQDGTVFYADVNSGQVLFDDKQCLMGIFRDVTEQRRVAAALRESESRYRELVDNTSVGLAVYEVVGNGGDFRFYDLNRAGERITQVRKGYVVGKAVTEVFPGVRELGLFSVLRRVARTGQPERMPAMLYEDGRLHLWIENYVYRLASGHVVVVFDDVTEREEARVGLHRLNQALEALAAGRTAELAAANQELDSLAYSIAHELRAPLRAIEGYARILLEEQGAQLPLESQDQLGRISLEALRMAALMDALLELCRATRSGLDYTDVDLGMLAREVVADLNQSQPERTVNVAIAEGMVGHGDPALLRRVMENLLGNAWKFTQGRPVGAIEFGATTGAGETTYFIRDNGVGFDMAHAGRLFVPFGRLHAMHEFAGSGMGLCIVQRIVARHGGRVWIDAAPGRGATAYFTLPHPPRPASPSRPPPAPTG